MKPPAGCPRCQGSMAEGFIIDQGHGQVHVSTWQEGEPKRSFWQGVKQSKADQLKVSSFRCERCGYLESYALPA